LKQPSTILVMGYLLVGAAGFGLIFALDANPIVETGFVFIAGLVLGFATEKFVKTRLRQPKPDLTADNNEKR
jgi:Na+/H+ antiporter NhaB